MSVIIVLQVACLKRAQQKYVWMIYCTVGLLTWSMSLVINCLRPSDYLKLNLSFWTWPAVESRLEPHFSHLATYRHYTTIHNNAFPVPTVVLVTQAVRAKFDVKVWHILVEMLEAALPEIASVFAIPATPGTLSNPTIDWILTAKPRDPTLPTSGLEVGKQGFWVRCNCSEFWVRLDLIVEAAQQAVVRPLQAYQLSTCHYPQLAGPLLKGSMYDTSRHKVYWPCMMSILYTTWKNLEPSTQQRESMATAIIETFTGQLSTPLYFYRTNWTGAEKINQQLVCGGQNRIPQHINRRRPDIEGERDTYCIHVQRSLDCSVWLYFCNWYQTIANILWANPLDASKAFWGGTSNSHCLSTRELWNLKILISR